MTDVKKRFLSELRVIDLRSELDKRNLDKSGVRGVLLKRLAKFLTEEGHDPDTFQFELATESKTPSKRSRSTSVVEPEPDEAPMDVSVEDMIVQDDVGEDDDTAEEDQAIKTKEEPASAPPSSDSTAAEKKTKDTAPNSDSKSRKREIKEESQATEAKKACLNKDVKEEDDGKSTEHNDAEDSINLDIGDDELLNDETENSAKTRKDDGETSAETDAEKAAASNAGASLEAAGDAGDSAVSDTPREVNPDVSATSEGNEDKKDKDEKDDKDEEEASDKKDRKDEGKDGSGAGARNLWVSGLSGYTRAKDLKQLCSKHGKVIGAKVVTNARTPGSRCYGYVTMSSSQDAENCIKNLHRTELHGRMISVERAKSESESSQRSSAPSRRSEHRRDERASSKDKSKEETKTENGDGAENADKSEEGTDKKEGETSGGEDKRSTSGTREKSHRSDKDKYRRERSRERRRSPREVLSFSKIWKERDMARARERSRAAREEERRRRAAEEVLRERERRQRQEKLRLALEREKLRTERERIEREKNELLRLERERHKLEREKLELERLELKRAQLRLEEERRKRTYESSAAYRKTAPSPPPPPPYERDTRHKRPPQPSLQSSGRGTFEVPPPPRFEISAAAYERTGDKRERERDYKRDYTRHVSSTVSGLKYPSNGAAGDDARQPLPPGTRPKEPSRAYESRDGRTYRSPPPGKPEPRTWSSSNRYPDTAAPSKSSSGGGESWSTSGAGDARYGPSYEPRSYPAAYQPPPPGAAPYPDRYAPPTRDYRQKY